MFFTAYQNDVINDYLQSYLDEIKVLRLRVVSNKYLKKSLNKTEVIINQMLKRN